MNRPARINIVQALTGKVPAFDPTRYAWQYTCPQCGRDNGLGDSYPLSIRCIGFTCDAEIEPTRNPLYQPPVSMLTLARAE